MLPSIVCTLDGCLLCPEYSQYYKKIKTLHKRPLNYQQKISKKKRMAVTQVTMEWLTTDRRTV